MAVTRAEKEQELQDLTSAFRAADTAILVDYRGLNVPQVTELRRQLRAARAQYKVVKNTLAKKASAGTPFSTLDGFFVGTTAIAYTEEDAVALAKVLTTFMKSAPTLAVKAAVVQGRAVKPAEVTDLANLPGNVCTPSYLGKTAEGLARTHKSLKVKVLGLPEIKREKMGCFLAVTQGSEEPPRFIVIEHRHPKAKGAPVVLVGKGITFDTGGISLKDPPTMDEMKFDMSGAACVIGTMNTVAELNLPIHVVGLVAACENMPDGRAIKPGDIVTSAQGLTVEILNTDAEGRLILCDALNYAKRFKPDVVIDMATLTGAIVVALGVHHTGVFSNTDSLARELVDCGIAADDRAWHMPVGDEYGDQLKSNFADMANVAGRDGGSCTAAAFLAKFTQGLTWAHLDIAGTAYQGGAGKGSTGRPSAMLLEFLLRRAGAR